MKIELTLFIGWCVGFFSGECSSGCACGVGGGNGLPIVWLFARNLTQTDIGKKEQLCRTRRHRALKDTK
jgi:hypothetical protein